MQIIEWKYMTGIHVGVGHDNAKTLAELPDAGDL
jgi:hypothetical protein